MTTQRGSDGTGSGAGTTSTIRDVFCAQAQGEFFWRGRPQPQGGALNNISLTVWVWWGGRAGRSSLVDGRGMTTGEQQQQQQQWATGGPVAVRRTTWSAASRPTDAAVSEATWQAALSSLRAGDTGKPVVDILKTHCQYSKRLLIELTTWPVDDLPGATVLNAVLGVVRRDTAIWLLTDADADQHYAQVLLSAKLGLAHPHALLRQCWSHALDLLLHEHLTRLPFPSLIVAFILTASIDPRLRLRWLTATVAFIRQLYKYGGQHRDLAPLQTLAAHADDLARFAIGSLSDANEGVRGRAAALLRLLLPICDADAATEAIPALLSAMDRHGTSSGSVHSGGTEASTRCRVEREIVMTEESYVAGLETLMRKVMEPLRAKRVIPDDKACALFANLPSIAALNKLLLADLQECSCTVQCACVPGVFVRFAGVFKLYSEYVNGFDRCLQMLSDLRDNVAFNRFLAGTGVQLTSLMISPIQRIPRYLLLLQELARHTPSDHTAFTVIQQAVDKIRAIADHLNDSKKRVEDLTKLLTLQARIAGRAPSLVKPDRELLLDGIVRKRSSSSTALSRRHARHVFVFSDMICRFGVGRPPARSFANARPPPQCGARRRTGSRASWSCRTRTRPGCTRRATSSSSTWSGRAGRSSWSSGRATTATTGTPSSTTPSAPCRSAGRRRCARAPSA